MRLCFLVNDFSSRGSGGIGTYVDTLAEELCVRGHRVVVLTTSATGRGNASYAVQVVPVPLGDDRSRLQVSRLFSEAIRNMHAEEPFDIVEATDWGVEGFYLTGVEGIRLVLRFHTPESVVVSLNGTSMFSDSLTVQSIEASYFSSGRFLSFPSRAMANLVLTKFNIHPFLMDVIPNPIRMTSYCSDDTQSGTRLPVHRVCFVGRLERRKGVYELAEALRTVLAATKNIEVDFVGSDTRHPLGTVGRDIRSILASHMSRVRFHGFIDKPTADAVISGCACMVIPSIWENFPYACLEAMARGKPIITTSGSGCDEIIENGVSGILVPPRNSAALADAILRVLEGKWGSLATNAKKSVASYDVRTLTTKFESFYREVMSI